MSQWPLLTVCIPTYNNEKTLRECLEYVYLQNYPKDRLEVLVIDGGSQDTTLRIAEEFGCKILSNSARVEERGRVLGMQVSRGEFISFVDADNFLVDTDFFKKHIEVFLSNPGIAFCEPLFYEARDRDDKITKYISLLGGDDPLAVYLRMNDRFSFLTNNWATDALRFHQQTETCYVFSLKNESRMPTFGANGTLYRKKAILSVSFEPFLHTDICFRLFKEGFLGAKTFVGLVHKQDGKISSFLAKKWRRLSRDYEGLQREFFFQIEKRDVLFLGLKCLLVLPLLFDALKGCIRKPSWWWLLHPILTEATFFLAIWATLGKKLKRYRKA